MIGTLSELRTSDKARPASPLATPRSNSLELLQLPKLSDTDAAIETNSNTRSHKDCTNRRELVDTALIHYRNFEKLEADLDELVHKRVIPARVSDSALKELQEIAELTNNKALKEVLRRQGLDIHESVLYDKPVLLGAGATARVYAISDHLCIKVGLCRRLTAPTKGILTEEFRIQQYLYDHGISVPRPIAHKKSSQLNLPEGLPRSDSVIVMERVQGEHSFLGSKREVPKRIQEIIEEQHNKAAELGFEPFDTEVIFDLNNNYATLVDVGFWKTVPGVKLQIAVHSIRRRLEDLYQGVKSAFRVQNV